jgi:hypothetical protein
MSLQPKQRFADVREMGRELLSLAGQRTRITWGLSFGDTGEARPEPSASVDRPSESPPSVPPPSERRRPPLAHWIRLTPVLLAAVLLAWHFRIFSIRAASPLASPTAGESQSPRNGAPAPAGDDVVSRLRVRPSPAGASPSVGALEPGDTVGVASGADVNASGASAAVDVKAPARLTTGADGKAGGAALEDRPLGDDRHGIAARVGPLVRPARRSTAPAVVPTVQRRANTGSDAEPEWAIPPLAPSAGPTNLQYGPNGSPILD